LQKREVRTWRFQIKYKQQKTAVLDSHSFTGAAMLPDTLESLNLRFVLVRVHMPVRHEVIESSVFEKRTNYIRYQNYT